MKILLTGNKSFIADAFTTANKQKHTITVAPDELQLDFVKVDKFIGANSFDVIIYDAGSDGNSGENIEKDNLVKFRNIQHSAILNGVKKLIVLTDASDIDCSLNVVDFSETTVRAVPTGASGLSRYLISLLAEKDKITTVLRFFGVYGAGADCGVNTLTDILARAIVGKKSVEIPDKKLSAVYIDDAVKVVEKFAFNDLAKGDYNVANPEPTTYFDFAKKAVAFAEKNEREVGFYFTHDETELTANTDKLNSVVQIRFTSHASGVKRTLEKLFEKKSLCRPKTADKK